MRLFFFICGFKKRVRAVRYTSRWIGDRKLFDVRHLILRYLVNFVVPENEEANTKKQKKLKEKRNIIKKTTLKNSFASVHVLLTKTVPIHKLCVFIYTLCA